MFVGVGLNWLNIIVVSDGVFLDCWCQRGVIDGSMFAFIPQFEAGQRTLNPGLADQGNKERTKKKKNTTLQFTPLKFGVILTFPPRISKFGLVPLLLRSILIGALTSIPGTNVSVKCRLSLSCMLVGPIKSCHVN